MTGKSAGEMIGRIDAWLGDVEDYEDHQTVEISVGLVRWLYVELSSPDWAAEVLSRKVRRAIEDKHPIPPRRKQTDEEAEMADMHSDMRRMSRND
jgi:hypothetical protein